MPASVFSRSTECHNQDKVSMGTIAARDCLRILELTEQAASGHLIAVCQAVRLRHRQGELTPDTLTPEIKSFHDDLEKTIPFIDEDKPLENELRALVEKIQDRAWVLYE